MSNTKVRLVPCGVKLRDEINAWNPKRDKSSDGWIGDAAHQARKSDHNPDSRGLVHALDVDKDGIDPHRLVRVAIADSRVEYVIYNRTIWSRSRRFKSRAYTGDNPHTGHVHISFRYGTQYENDVRAWNVAPKATPPAPKPNTPKPTGIPEVRLGSRTLRHTSPAMRGTDIIFVQKYIGEKYMGKADGIAGPKFEAGVKWYQRMRGIKDDGIVGPVTWGQMGVKYKK